ncbi:MAG: mercury(II) reductase [candidate division KSB1 bacterium]|nr:mercury(II) reductase [candidate division KSB1 bacterium]
MNPTDFPASRNGSEFDLIVIGTGGGGTAAAIRAAELGYRVAIIEAGTIGGTCVNIGCIPSKAIIRAAKAYHTAGHHPFAGLRTRAEGVDWPQLISQKDHLVAELRQQKYIDILQSYDTITLIQGHGRFNSRGEVVIDQNRVLRGDRVIIATGAQPKILPIDGIDQVRVLNSTTLMALERQPESLLVIGGRAIALELGQAMARLGTRVTILQRSSRLLPEHDPEISRGIQEALESEGIEVVTGAVPEKICEIDGQKEVTARVNGSSRKFHAEGVLMAVGRVPNTDNLGLEEIGVTTDANGFILVDAFLRTNRSGVFAVGDVTRLPKLVYVAAAAGTLAAENALTQAQRQLDLNVLPEVIFTDPQIATVGMTEQQAREAGHSVKVAHLPLEHVPRALTEQDRRGFIRLIADADHNTLLGAHILAAEAGEIIQTAALAMEFGRRHGYTVDELRSMLFPYLTQVEGIKLAAQTFDKDVAKLSCCAG